MNPTIKARIESIRRGEVPEGYKRTKAGILPVDWEFNPLCQLAQKSKTKNREERYTKILTNSANEGIISQTDYFDKQIANNDNIEGYYIVKKGDFVYNPRISVAAPCGPINCYHGEETGVMSPLYTVFSIDVKKIERDYVEQFFSSTFWHRYMKSVANYGVRSDRMNLSDEDFFLLPIPMPMRTEQEKIAEILAGQDRVIALKEKLLAEKQKQKKYLMQQLLTGKKRLPGFSGEWILSSLGQLTNMYSGGTPSRSNPKYYGNDYIWVSIADINLSGKYIASSKTMLSQLGYENSSAKLYPINTVLFAMYASIGECAITMKECCSSQAIVGIIPNETLNVEFLYYFLYNQKEVFKSMGQASSQPNLNKDIVQRIKIVLPSLKEQTAIAEILSTADKEIELLKKDIEQEKLKKKSLMQLLLTGIVRVDELVS